MKPRHPRAEVVIHEPRWLLVMALDRIARRWRARQMALFTASSEVEKQEIRK